MEKNIRLNKVQIATAITSAFHISGFIAIAFFHATFFVQLTPLNLLIGFGLILWTQEKINWAFITFLLFASLIGFTAEIIGVNTGYLFGNYNYGQILGVAWKGVPLIIGINWFIVLYGAGVSMYMLKEWIMSKLPSTANTFPQWYFYISLVADTATLAVIFDWAIEPVAIKLGFWHWANNEIPAFNTYSWFGVSLIIALVFHALSFKKHNLFAVHLLMIQFLFFLLLKIYS